MDARAAEPHRPSAELGQFLFPDAGDDSDLREAFEVDQRWDAAHHAYALLSEAKQLAMQAEGVSDDEERRQQWVAAENAARGALGVFRAALDYAEDSEDEDAAHRALDEAGRWVREVFGCQLGQEGIAYQYVCPVALGHNRIGFSIGGPAVRKCSLCGDYLSECPHVQGRAYLVPGGSADLGWCRVCGEQSCDHSPDEQYRIGVTAIITRIDLEEVSLVSRPAFATARIQSLDIDVEDLREALGPRFEPGMPVSCDRCLTACGGLRKHPRHLSSKSHSH